LYTAGTFAFVRIFCLECQKMMAWRFTIAAGAAMAVVAPLCSESAPGMPADPKRPVAAASVGGNRNRLLDEHRGKVKITASSVYNGWPLDNLLDGKDSPAYFSGSGDSAARGQSPWVEVEFPAGVTLRRFTVIGCRDVSYPQGYFVLAGALEVRDVTGRVVYQGMLTGAGKSHDFDFIPERALTRVKTVRFTSLADQGDVNGSGDVALSELLAD
jgi:hypothetical protein